MPAIPFDPVTSGFQFVNSWTLDDIVSNDLRDQMIATVNGVSTFLTAVPLLALLRPFVLRSVAGWVQNASTQHYGLCGGMAFAALDYYTAGRALPDERGPADALSPALRDYIVRRMKDSLLFTHDGVIYNNLGRVLAWMVVSQYMPFGRGKQFLMNESRAQGAKLRTLITQYGAWPLALIGESKDPCENHQVLAYHLEPGDVPTAIYVYDMNHPGAGRKIALAFSNAALEGYEDEFPNDSWEPLRGFFCEEYSPVVPPL